MVTIGLTVVCLMPILTPQTQHIVFCLFHKSWLSYNNDIYKVI